MSFIVYTDHIQLASFVNSSWVIEAKINRLLLRSRTNWYTAMLHVLLGWPNETAVKDVDNIRSFLVSFVCRALRRPHYKTQLQAHVPQSLEGPQCASDAARAHHERPVGMGRRRLEVVFLWCVNLSGAYRRVGSRRNACWYRTLWIRRWWGALRWISALDIFNSRKTPMKRAKKY